MSLHVFSRRALAIVLSVAMLMSCMVFSFSASAATTLLWENDFSDTTAPWYGILESESGKGNFNSGTVGRSDVTGGNYAVYDSGAMKLGFASWESRTLLSGFTVRHKTATVKGAAAGTYGGGDAAEWRTEDGAFSPTAGKYKIEFDYKLNDLVDDASTIYDICVGFANAEAMFWDGDKSFAYFTDATRQGEYQVVASVKLSDLGMDWANAVAYAEIEGNDDRSMYIFLSNRNDGSNPIGSVLIDNIRVSAVDEIPSNPGGGGEEPTPTPTPTPSEDVRWENNFDDPSSSNWYSKLQSESAGGPWNSGTVLPGMYAGANYAVYNEGGYMALGFKSWQARNYLSGFYFRHKSATDKSITDAYGTAGGAVYETNVGAFAPIAGKYQIDLSYKVNTFPDSAPSAIDICVGFANQDTFYWDSDRSIDYFTDATREGVYQKVVTVSLADLDKGWKNTSVTIDLTGDGDKAMHLFLMNAGTDTLDGAEVLIDNVTVRKCEDDPTPTGPVLMWKNAYDNGDTVNWASAYGGKEDGSYWNSGKVHTDVKNYSVVSEEGDNSFMALGFANEAARSKMSGFVFLHEEATHNFAGQYGYAGGMAGTPQGRVVAQPGYYIISFDYKLNAITDKTGAAFDFGVSFCGDLLWDGQAGVDAARLGAFGGDPKNIVTLTASDLGNDWAHVTYQVSNLSQDAMFIYFYVAAAEGYDGSLEGSELWIDNIEIQQNFDQSLYTKVTFWHNGFQVGQSKGSLPGMYFEMPELNLPTIPDGYKVVYYSDEECKTMIPAPTAYPDESTNVYVRIVQDTGNVWGFETEANDTLLSINARVPETIITVDDTVAHSGGAAARINSDGGLGSPNLHPQMLLKNGFDKQIEVGVGRTYQVRFYLYIPAGQDPYEIEYWLTATEETTEFHKNYDDAYSVKNYAVAEGKQMIDTAGEWVEVNVTIDDCPYAGYLRLGLNGDGNKDYPFYIDDIAVISTPADSNAWSFETEANDTLLSVNTRLPETTIYTDDSSSVFSGIAAARINSDGGLGCPNLYPQMMVKNGAGEQVYVYKSRNYEVKFYLFIPEGQPLYEVTYWLTATEEETVFARDYEDAYSVKYYKVGEGACTPSAVGEWVEVTVAITDCPLTGKLRIGFNGSGLMTHPFYIDDLSVTEVTKEPDAWLESYERYTPDQQLALNTDGASITVSDGDRLSGDYSAKIVTLGNGINTAPQMVVSNNATKPVKVEKGKSYHVTFWVCQPIDAPDYDIKYWLAVTDSAAAFTTGRDNVVIDTQTVVIKDKQAWQLIRADIKDCPYSGTLRLGITGSTDEAHTFYLDDIYVKEIEPADGAAMNFEMYEPGTTLHINEDNNTFTVSDAESYTGGQSVYVHADNNHENRPQMPILDAEGNQVKVKKGDNFYVTFMVYIPETEPYFNFSYYVAAVPDDVVNKAFRYRSSFVVDDYKLGGQEWTTPPPAGEWTQIKIAVLDCPVEGNLRIGLCHGNGHPFESNFYVDDIKVYEPEYVLVKFDTNGSEDTFEDMLLLSDMLVPYEGVDPYREGYEFMGWYTSPDFNKDSFFDIYTMPIVGKTGDTVTLYARWRQWEDAITTGGQNSQDNFKIEYYTDKVWVGDQNVPENPYTTGEFDIGAAAPIVSTPDDGADDGGLPPWLIVVIIVGAVVIVGGGAVLAALLLKKNKKKEEA